MAQGLVVYDSAGVEVFNSTHGLARILHDATATYTRSMTPGSRYSGSVSNDGLKTGDAWFYIYDVRYYGDASGDETGLYDVQTTHDRSAGTLDWSATSLDSDVFTHEIRVLVGVK